MFDAQNPNQAVVLVTQLPVVPTELDELEIWPKSSRDE